MSMIKYDKLVRDNIIEKIESKGGTAKYHIADQDEFERKLTEKLVEESQELNKAKTVEEIKHELGDVLRVVQEIKKFYNIREEEIAEIMQKKDEKAGGFDKRIILDEASEIKNFN